MKILINLSNHHSAKWSSDQAKEWTKIINIDFPHIPADLTGKAVKRIAENYAQHIIEVKEKLKNSSNGIVTDNDVFVYFAGEYSFCYYLLEELRGKVRIVIPTSERIKTETINPDGTVTGKVIFKFCQWREL